jgi:Na+/H+ antiporter NhaD/arsenite permease-like protein
LYEGTIGADNISPYDVVIVFLCLGYIASFIEDSGLIRYLAFRVIRLGGGVGRRLFFYLYASFFGLGIFIGNDPIMVLFLAYMTRLMRNILHPRAWIYTQFAVANIAAESSSHPTQRISCSPGLSTLSLLTIRLT